MSLIPKKGLKGVITTLNQQIFIKYFSKSEVQIAKYKTRYGVNTERDFHYEYSVVEGWGTQYIPFNNQIRSAIVRLVKLRGNEQSGWFGK